MISIASTLGPMVTGLLARRVRRKLLTASSASSALGAALTADAVAPGALGGAMARYTGAGSLVAVLSFAVTGHLYSQAGPATLLVLTALLGSAALTLRLGPPRLAAAPAAATDASRRTAGIPHPQPATSWAARWPRAAPRP